MKEMVNLNFRWFMQTLLDRKDRMSMWSGLEVRVPFCDYRIAEYLYGVPWSFKDLEGMEKGLLRKAMEDFLPGGPVEEKSPYPKTHNPAYLEEVSRRLRALFGRGQRPHFPNRQPPRPGGSSHRPVPLALVRSADEHSSDHRLHAPGEPLDGGLSGGAGVTEGAWLPRVGA